MTEQEEKSQIELKMELKSLVLGEQRINVGVWLIHLLHERSVMDF
jgi:hypothetical protein